VQDPSQLPQDYLPDWLKAGLTLIAGGGAVHYLKVWLESRRLSNSDFRQTLLDRIHSLETKIEGMHVEIGDLRVKLASEIIQKRALERELAAVQTTVEEVLPDADPEDQGGRHEQS
jgi:hypothetical protein